MHMWLNILLLFGFHLNFKKVIIYIHNTENLD